MPPLVLFESISGRLQTGSIMDPRQRAALPTLSRQFLSALCQRAATKEDRAGPVARPDVPSEVAAMLRVYIARRLGIGPVKLHVEPQELPDGWETYNYAFQFAANSSLPEGLARPLILRIFAHRNGLPRARHEWAVLTHLDHLGFPVTQPLLLEESCNYFGGPFLLRARSQGPTLLRSALNKPWTVWSAGERMGKMHAWLHQLPISGFPAPPGSFLGRSLRDMTQVIAEGDCQGLQPGLQWLSDHRPSPPVRASILHLDFHPLNLIEQADRSLVAIDWTEADVGDPHADVGTTRMLLACIQPKHVTALDRLGLFAGGLFFRRRYLIGYRRCLPIDKARLVYYQAWAALRRLCHYSRWLRASPAVTGCKPSALEQLSGDHVHTLEAYFQKWTGTPVHLDADSLKG